MFLTHGPPVFLKLLGTVPSTWYRTKASSIAVCGSWTCGRTTSSPRATLPSERRRGGACLCPLYQKKTTVAAAHVQNQVYLCSQTHTNTRSSTLHTQLPQPSESDQTVALLPLPTIAGIVDFGGASWPLRFQLRRGEVAQLSWSLIVVYCLLVYRSESPRISSDKSRCDRDELSAIRFGRAIIII